MIGDFFVDLVASFLVDAPVLSIPDGFSSALTLFSSLVGYINVFVPLARLAPILGLIVLIRNWNIVVSIVRFVLRFIPFVG